MAGGILPKIREIDTENLGFISGRVGPVGVLAFGRGRVGRVGVSDPLRKLLLELRKHPHRLLMASSDGSALPSYSLTSLRKRSVHLAGWRQCWRAHFVSSVSVLSLLIPERAASPAY